MVFIKRMTILINISSSYAKIVFGRFGCRFKPLGGLLGASWSLLTAFSKSWRIFGEKHFQGLFWIAFGQSLAQQIEHVISAFCLNPIHSGSGFLELWPSKHRLREGYCEPRRKAKQSFNTLLRAYRGEEKNMLEAFLEKDIVWRATAVS